jgi:hypothetical protein
MKFLLALLPAVLYAQLEGKVVSSVTRAGLPAVGINITSTTGRRITYTGVTEDDGSFRIGAIDQDGEYVVTFTHGGYRNFSSHVHITAAAPPPKMQVELAPLPSLRGRVIDGDGHPVAQARVHLLSVAEDWAFSTVTAKDGTFTYQSTVPTPAFVLRAEPPKELAPPKSSEDEPRVWAPTFYPDGTGRFQAVRIVWRDGADLDGYTIKLRAVPVFHIRGTVVDDAGKRVEGAVVKLARADMPLPVALNSADGQATTGPNGAFDLPQVRPGEWMLTAELKPLRATVRGIVSRTDWDDVRLKLQAPFTVRGTVEGLTGAGVNIVLAPTDRGSLMRITAPGRRADGTFEIPDVYPGQYRILATASQALYVDSVERGGRDIMTQPFDLMDGSLPVHVVYKANGGRVLGSVEGCTDVVIVPKDRALSYAGLVRTAGCDDKGHFEIAALRPGDYYVAAYDRRPVVLDDEFLAGIASVGAAVTVEAGQSTLAAVKLTTLVGQ